MPLLTLLRCSKKSSFCRVLVILLCSAFACRAKGLNFTLESSDGSYYPNLDGLLYSSNSSIVVGTVQELQALPRFNVTTKSLPVTRKVVVVSESFFSVFSSAQVRLWESDADGKPVVPAYFEVSGGGELLLLGFTLNWAATSGTGRPNVSTPSPFSNYAALQQLIQKLGLYVELSGNAKLQLLRTTIEGLTCGNISRLYTGLAWVKTQPGVLAAVSGGVVPELRFVYPYLFIKYAQLGPIWVEDLTLSCAASTDLSPAACLPAPPAVYNISSHDDLMSALAAVEATDITSCVTTRTVLRLVNDVTLDVARWPRDRGGVFLTSNISFECDPGQMLVLDFNGGLNLFKLRAAAYVRMVNLVVTNLPLAPVGVYVVPLWSFSFPRELTAKVEGRLHMVNTTGVIPADEFSHLQYWATILIAPQSVAQLAGWQRLIQYIELTSSTNTTMIFNRISGMGITCDNIALTTVPHGPPLLQPRTGVDQLLGDGVRSGPPYTIAVYGAAQLVRIFNTPDFRIARLAEQDGLTGGNTTDVLLLLQSNITLSRDIWPDGLTVTVRRKVTVQGRPFTNIVLDFGGGTSFLAAAGSGQVQFGYLTLVGAGWRANYTQTTAAANTPVMEYLQEGMWPVVFDRSGLPPVTLRGVTLRVSGPELDLLFACLDSYTSSPAKDSPLLRGGLTAEMCQQIMPDSAQVSNSNRSGQSITVTTMKVSAFYADHVVLAADPAVSRPDLEVLLGGGYPPLITPSPNPSSSASSRNGKGPNIAAIVGGAVGGALGCVLLAAILLFHTSRRSRARAQEQQLQSLQAKQAHQLEELSKTNPLAQLILDHLAGKEPPGVAQLVVGAGKMMDPSCAGSNSGGADGATATATATGTAAVRTGSSGAAAATAATAAGSGTAGDGGGGASEGGGTSSPSGPGGSGTPPEEAGGKGQGQGQAQEHLSTALNAMPVNIAATDLAELFKHLTILGVANLSHNNTHTDGQLGQPDSRGSRARSSSARTSGVVSAGPGAPAGGGAGAPGAGAGAPAGVMGGSKGKPEHTGLTGFAHAIAQKLHRRGSANGGGHHSGGDAAAAATSTETQRVADGRRVTASGEEGQEAKRQGQGKAAEGAGVVAAAAAGAAGNAGDGSSDAKASEAGEAAVGATAAAGSGAGAKCGAAEGAGGTAVAAATAATAAGATREGAATGSGGTRMSEDRTSDGHAVVPAVPEGLPEQLTQSPVLEELLRLSLDLAGEIDDNQLTVTEVVASGGFGTVYKGMWHNLPVAVKIVLFSTASVNRRIALQEAALSKSISHPNIIATYAVDAKPMAVLGRAGGAASGSSSSQQGAGGGAASKAKPKTLAEIQEWRLYIIQEFADGGTLRRALDRGTFHDPHSGLPRMDMLLDIAQGVAAALAHLHSKNVVHGDLNPKNVLLKIAPLPLTHSYAGSARSAGGIGKGGWPSASVHPAKTPAAAAAAAAVGGAAAGETATTFGNYPLAGRCGFAIKVADFGLSVKMENSHISGLRQGTPFYAAPELTTGIFSRAADMYAFGVLLWELYWGRPIWVPDARAPGGYVQHEDFPLLPHDCPPEYLALVADCLQLNHLQRPAFEEILVRLKAMAHAAMYGPGSALTSGSVTSFDSSYSLTMPGLPVFLQNPQLYINQQQQQQHGLAYAYAQAQAQAQPQQQQQLQLQQLLQQQQAAAAARRPQVAAVAGTAAAMPMAAAATAAALAAAGRPQAASQHQQQRHQQGVTQPQLQQEQHQHQHQQLRRPSGDAPLQGAMGAAAAAGAAHGSQVPPQGQGQRHQTRASASLPPPQHQQHQQHLHLNNNNQLAQQRATVAEGASLTRRAGGTGAAAPAATDAAAAAAAAAGVLLEGSKATTPHRHTGAGTARVFPSAPPLVPTPPPTQPAAAYMDAAAANYMGAAETSPAGEAARGSPTPPGTPGMGAGASEGCTQARSGGGRGDPAHPAPPAGSRQGATMEVELTAPPAAVAHLSGSAVAAAAGLAGAGGAAPPDATAMSGVRGADAGFCGSDPCVRGQGAGAASTGIGRGGAGTSAGGAPSLAGLSSPLDTRGPAGQPAALSGAAGFGCFDGGGMVGKEGLNGGVRGGGAGQQADGTSWIAAAGLGVAAVAEGQCGDGTDDDSIRMLNGRHHGSGTEQPCLDSGVGGSGGGGGCIGGWVGGLGGVDAGGAVAGSQQWVAAAAPSGAWPGGGLATGAARMGGATQAMMAAAALEVIAEEEAEDSEDGRRACRLVAER